MKKLFKFIFNKIKSIYLYNFSDYRIVYEENSNGEKYYYGEVRFLPFPISEWSSLFSYSGKIYKFGGRSLGKRKESIIELIEIHKEQEFEIKKSKIKKSKIIKKTTEYV